MLTRKIAPPRLQIPLPGVPADDTVQAAQETIAVRHDSEEVPAAVFSERMPAREAVTANVKGRMGAYLCEIGVAGLTGRLMLTALIFLVCNFSAAHATQRDVQSLDGTWSIVFDADNEGREAGWQRSKVFSQLKGRRDIVVPSCWEEIEKDYEGVAWYHRRFKVPRDWRGRVTGPRMNIQPVHKQRRVLRPICIPTVLENIISKGADGVEVSVGVGGF